MPRVVRWLSLLLCVYMIMIMFTALCVWRYGNLLGPLAGIAVGIVATVLWNVLRAYISPPDHWSNETLNYHMPAQEKLTWVSLTWLPLAFSILLFNVVFVGSGVCIWVCEDRTTVNQRVIVGMPFVQNIQPLERPLPHFFSFNAVATTKDGKKVQGELHPDVHFIPDESLLVELVKKMNGANEAIREELQKQLTASFQKVVAQHTLAELTSTIVIEWETGSDTNLNTLGMEWIGTLEILRLHAFFGPS